MMTPLVASRRMEPSPWEPCGPGDASSWVERPPLPLARGTVDFARSRFLRHDRRIEPLSPLEARMLAYLADRPNRVVPRDELLTRVWAHADPSMSRAVDTAISRLRRKLEPDPSVPEMLFTVHSAGYRLLVDGAPEPAAVTPPVASRRLLLLSDRVADLTAGYVDGAAGRAVLSAQERLLLEELLRVEGAAVPASRITRRLGVSEGALRNAVLRLRSKIEADPRRPAHLLSVRDGAYRLEARVETPAPAPAAQREALESLTHYVGRVLGLPDCVVYLLEGDRLRQVAAFGPKRAADGGVRDPLSQAIGEGLVGAAAAQREPVLCLDTAEDSRYLPDLVPARAELAVSVRAAGRLVGVIDTEHPRPGALDDHHVQTFVCLAAIAAPAFARLHGGFDV